MRVLFTSTSGWGHIHPMVPLARAFLDRGDDVMWATGDEVCGRLEREGIATSAAGSTTASPCRGSTSGTPRCTTVPPPERSDFMFPRLFGAVRAEAMLDDLLPVAQACSPDLLVCDAAEFAGPIAAAVVSAPNITLSFGGPLPEPRVAATGVAVEPLWAAHGLDGRPYGGTYDNLYLDIYPSSMQSADRPHIPAIQPLRPGAFATGEEEPLPDWVTAAVLGSPRVRHPRHRLQQRRSRSPPSSARVRELPVRVVVTVGPRGEPRGARNPTRQRARRPLHPPDPAARALLPGRVPRRVGNVPRRPSPRSSRSSAFLRPPTSSSMPPPCARAGAGIALPPGRALSRSGERRRRESSSPIPPTATPLADVDQRRDRGDALPGRSRGQVARQLRLSRPHASVGRVTGLNRTENLRPIPPADPDFARLYPRRNDAESINRDLDDTLYLRRAHSVGHARQHLNLLGYALVVNAVALHRHHRTRIPDQLAA